MPENNRIKNGFEIIQEKTTAETAVAEVVKSEAAEISLRSIAMVKARYESYKDVYKNYEKFIKDSSKDLKGGKLKESAFKELGVARLIAAWIVDTEKFLEESEDLLANADRKVRGNFIKESLSGLPNKYQTALMSELDDKKGELIEWLAKTIQKYKKLADKDAAVAAKKDAEDYVG